MRNYLVLAAALITFSFTSCKEFTQPIGEEMTIFSLDGSEHIADADSTFTAHIDHNFNSYGLDEDGYSTGYCHVKMYEITRTGTAKQIFSSIPADLNKLVLTQHQIINICEEYREQLGQYKGVTTFFLTRVLMGNFNYEYFVVEVGVKSGNRLSVFVHRYNDNPVIYTDIVDVRIVVPVI